MNAQWTTYEEQLMVALVNQVRILAWQNTEDGHKGRNAPEPLLLPDDILAREEKKQRDTARAKALAERHRNRKVG